MCDRFAHSVHLCLQVLLELSATRVFAIDCFMLPSSFSVHEALEADNSVVRMSHVKMFELELRQGEQVMIQSEEGKFTVCTLCALVPELGRQSWSELASGLTCEKGVSCSPRWIRCGNEQCTGKQAKPRADDWLTTETAKLSWKSWKCACGAKPRINTCYCKTCAEPVLQCGVQIEALALAASISKYNLTR